MSTACHRMLSTQLRNDPVFAFDFVRRFRDIPPIAPDDIHPMLVMSLLPRKGADPKIDMVDLTMMGEVRPDTKPLPDREPWPERWMVSIEILDQAPSLRVLIDWPHRYALLRAQFRCPLTPMVVVPTFSLANYINDLFAIEPELTPVVVVSQGVVLPAAANGPLMH